MADNEAFEATLDEWRKKATPAHLAVYATRDLPEDSIAKWKPYHHHLFINKVLTEAVTDPKRRFVNLEVSVRHGKALALDTPIFTPSGWTTMGELEVGDKVFGPDGEPCSVTAVMDQPPSPIHRLHFEGAVSIDSHANHEWATLTEAESSAYQGWAKRRPEPINTYPAEWWNWKSKGRGKVAPKSASVKTSAEIAATIESRPGHLNHRIPTAAPVQLPEADLPIDPWVLGYWLGNGDSAGGRVTTGSEVGGGKPDRGWVKAQFEAAGYATTENPNYPTHLSVLGLKVQLRDLGVLGNKHVPDSYLMASESQRRALLAGLMDADGGNELSRGEYLGRVSFTSTDERLTRAVEFLLRSLGATTISDARPAKLNGKVCGTAHRTGSACPFNPFLLPRKADKWKPGSVGRLHRMIQSVEVLGDAPTRCIEVSHPSHLYLAGEALIPTHNSMLTTLYLVVWFLGMYPDKRVAIITHSGDFAKQWGEATRDLFKVVGPDLFGLKVSESSSSKTLWNIEGRKGGVIALGRGAAIEGQGIDLAVLDDLLDQQAADSPTEMRKAWEWYQEGLRPRMMPGSTVVMVMSRWRVDDPAGRIEEQMRENPDGDRWETIHLPAIAECPKDEDPDTWTDVIGRKDGEALWPEVWPVDDLLQIKASVDPMVWESRFQQNPSPREGGMFKVDNWMRRPSAPEGLTKVRCWDLAATKGGGDWTVGVLMGRDSEDRFFVLDVQRFRMDGNEVKKQVLATARADGKGVTIRIEQERAGAGKAVIADYRRMLVGYNLIGAKPEGTKEQRAMPYAAQQQDGNIYLVNSIGWEKDFIEEHRTFPRGRHDDQCLVGDTLVQTAAGPKRLDAVRVGDSVLGATGWVDVEWAGMTSPSAPTVQMGPLTGTPTHPVWTGRGWVGLSDLRQDDTMLQWHAVQSRDAVPRSRRGDGAVATTGHGGDAATLSPSKPPDSTRRAECAAVAGRSCATCATGTTPSGAGMEIPSTEGQSTGRCVSMKSYSTASASAGTRTQTNPTTGATTPPGDRTSLGVLSHSTARSGSSTTAPSRTEPLSTTLTRTHSTTTSTTLPSWMEEDTSPTTPKASVRTPSVLTSNPSAISLPHGTARMRVVSGIENTHADRGSAPVFNLRTSDGTFFANGILVHNCDAASGAFDELTQLQPASVEWNQEMSTENVVDYLTSANPYFANA